MVILLILMYFKGNNLPLHYFYAALFVIKDKKKT